MQEADLVRPRHMLDAALEAMECRLSFREEGRPRYAAP